jgi:hypothetical protein
MWTATPKAGAPLHAVLRSGVKMHDDRRLRRDDNPFFALPISAPMW